MERAVVLVVGGSSGIGRACAVELAGRGHSVYGSSRDPGFRPAEFAPIQLDVRDAGSIGRAVAQLVQIESRIDVVVNSAGYGLAGAVEDTSFEEAHAQMDTNFYGVLRVCQAVIPQMRRQRSGLIINVSSLAGVMGLPFQGIYSASKFAVEGLTESLRQEVRPFGIQVTSLQPGDVCTAITDNRVICRQASSASSYRPAFERTMAIVASSERNGASARVVARRAAALLHVGRPDVRYTAGPFSQRLSAQLKRVLPGRLFERFIMAYFGLDTAR
jgi:NAD(P)-dependent dehydrogenase (short-subunit alcohol dehydrogenase family)